MCAVSPVELKHSWHLYYSMTLIGAGGEIWINIMTWFLPSFGSLISSHLKFDLSYSSCFFSSFFFFFFIFWSIFFCFHPPDWKAGSRCSSGWNAEMTSVSCMTMVVHFIKVTALGQSGHWGGTVSHLWMTTCNYSPLFYYSFSCSAISCQLVCFL